MKKQLFLLSTLCLALSACDNATSKGTTHNTGSQTGQNRTNPADYPADNTGRNVRDRSNQNLTSGDQSESSEDRTITQKIRRALMEDDSLSTNAKNIKIITINGLVTLRGPVNNDKEKSEIAKKSRAVEGVKNVKDEIEVVRSDQPSNAGHTRSDMRDSREVNR